MFGVIAAVVGAVALVDATIRMAALVLWPHASILQRRRERLLLHATVTGLLGAACVALGLWLNGRGL